MKFSPLLVIFILLGCAESGDGIQLKLVNRSSQVLIEPYVRSHTWECRGCGSHKYLDTIAVGGQSEFATLPQFNTGCFFMTSAGGYGYGVDCIVQHNNIVENGKYALYVFDTAAMNYVERID